MLGKNFIHLQELLDRFVKKTMYFMKSNETEIATMKNKVTQDLLKQERAVDTKQK